MLLVEYHPSSSDPMYLPWSSARGGFYFNPLYLPSVVTDGVYERVGSYGSAAACASVYRTDINNRLPIASNVSIHGIYNYSLTTLSTSVVFKLEDPVTLSSPVAVVAVLEDGIFYGGRTYNHVVRTGSSRNITLAQAGDSVTVSMDFPIGSSWNLDNLHCVAWLQSNSSSVVYQAAELPMYIDFTFDFAGDQTSIPEGNGEAVFEGLLTNSLETPQTLTLVLEDTFGWTTEFKVDGEADFHSDPSDVELDPLESIGVTLRVTTDGTRRIGEGGLQIHSSARVAIKRCRIFNGSPSILFVDDDGSYPDEDALLAALGAKDYLYDAWDVKQVYGRSPTVDEMNKYDATIWHSGRPLGKIKEDDILLLRDYLDAGGGLVLSYQHLLNYADTSSVATDHTFLTDYLGIQSYTLDVGADSLIGAAGDPIGDGIAMPFDYASSVLNKADALVAQPGSDLCFYSQAGDGIAIRTTHDDGRVVFYACLLNSIGDTEPDPNNLATLLDRSVQWVLERNSASVTDGPLPALSGIRLISPNPFRAGLSGTAMSIRLSLPDAAVGQPVRLDVFDLNGRLVRNLLDRSLSSAATVAAWDGRNASGETVGSGIYYLRLQTALGSDRAPMVVVR